MPRLRLERSEVVARHRWMAPGHCSTHADLVDHFRASGTAHDDGWEERWVRDEGYLKIAAGTLAACLAAAITAALDADGVLFATIDMAGRTMNVFSSELMDAIDALMDRVDTDAMVKSCVVTSGKPTLLAGFALAGKLWSLASRTPGPTSGLSALHGQPLEERARRVGAWTDADPAFIDVAAGLAGIAPAWSGGPLTLQATR